MKEFEITYYPGPHHNSRNGMNNSEKRTARVIATDRDDAREIFRKSYSWTAILTISEKVKDVVVELK